MRTVELKVSDKVYGKLMWFLNKFSSDEIEFVEPDQDFITTQNYLHAELQEMNEGKAEYYTQEEFEKVMDDVIIKHEKNNI